ncbi:Pc12g06450 [Penicillium rubens Wisconsin 54-1255]|uniref:Pc12g06450 protein n=1 Tax=Penicillium rubens (strain ATCC 28089 / DSM 1075 / NRRL 1951 / Wisconsin 54-1255) TaxID=500485 RepID=B6H0E1_PENRW|nr:Pc12g06450 [Penicillium rubens Wisconsin 54-1255]
MWDFKPLLLTVELRISTGATALPQGIIIPSSVSSATTATPTGTPVAENGRKCDFNTMNDFFDYTKKNGLNITLEVQNCQNLCLLTYGVGNPDLSGIGMMYAYSIQTGLTILVGPVYRILYLALAPASSFIRDLKDIQTNFFSSNGFFVGSSAIATLANLSQNPSTFEVAEMQAMAFLQVNSILVTFFCMVVAQPMSRWAARVLLYCIVFVLVVVALGLSHLGSDSRANWRLASDGCAHSSTDYSVINPVPYPSWAVAIFTVAGTIAFWLQSLKEKFQADKLHKSLFRLLMTFWVLLIGLLTAGMVVGLTMMWRQRRHLRSLVRDQFEDDQWGFGQIAALTIWAPIVVELIYILNDLVQRKSKRWNRWNQTISVYFSPKALQEDQATLSSDPQAEMKEHGASGKVTDVASS